MQIATSQKDTTRIAKNNCLVMTRSDNEFTKNHVDDSHVYEPESFLLIRKTSTFADKSEKNNMYPTKDNSNCNGLSFLCYLCIAIGLNHTSATLSPGGLKTFAFAHRNSFQTIQLEARVRNLMSMANMAAARIRPITAHRLAQLVEHRTTVWDFPGSKLPAGPTTEKVLSLY